MRDERTVEQLEHAARTAWRLGLRLAWSDGLEGPAAKRCQRNGWKKAAALNTNEGAALGFFATRSRKANPAVPAVANELVLVEADLDVPDDAYPPLDEVRSRVAALLRRLGLRFPSTVIVRSRRGLHFYMRPPAGQAPSKVQLAEAGDVVTWNEDGYVVGVPGLHELAGVVYEYVRDGEVATLPADVYERLYALGGESRSEQRRAFAAGEPIPTGSRRETIFGLALERVRDRVGRAEIIDELAAVNEARCTPPLERDQVAEQIDGAIRWARKNPTETEKARAQARALLAEPSRVEDAAGGVGGVGQAPPRKARALFLPFTDVNAGGPVRWVWRGKVPEAAVTLLAGRPKLGKSLLSIWLGAQLSRGLLEGAHAGKPARTLLIAAEDPVDTIVKARLTAAAADESYVGTLASRPPRPPSSSWGVERGSGGQERHEHGQDPQAKLGGLGGLDGLGTFARRITIPDEYELLEEIVVANEIALVVLDPINSFLSHKIDAHRDVEIRRVLDPLAALCARRHFAALAVVHLNRRTDSDVLNRITGSGGYGGSARSILTFGRHPEHDLQRVVASEGNWQRESRSELFELREVIVFPDAAPDDQTQPALVHVGTTDLDSSDLVDQLDDDRSALEQAKEFLLGELALGPVAVVDLKRGADANGISWRTVERAKKLLGVEARRISSASAPRGAGRWEWFLELQEQEEPAG
jgi:hypothetical protein